MLVFMLIIGIVVFCADIQGRIHHSYLIGDLTRNQSRFYQFVTFTVGALILAVIAETQNI